MDDYPSEYWEPFADHSKREENTVKLAGDLIDEYPDVGALVVECTVLQLYSRAFQEATGLPVYDITTLVKMVQSAFGQ